MFDHTSADGDPENRYPSGSIRNTWTTHNRHYEKLSNIAYNSLKDVPYLIVNRSNGAFYLSVVFNEASLNDRQKLHIKQPKIRQYVEQLMSERIEFDKRFVYYLLGSTGI